MRTPFVGLCFVLVTILPVASQEHSDIAVPFDPAGASPVVVYKPLTKWESVKLGAAYFTDPKRIQATQFAYEYDPAAFREVEQQAILDNLAQDGVISCALSSYNSSVLIIATSCRNVPAFPLASSGFRIISPKPNLLNEKPSAVLITEDSLSQAYDVVPAK